ncbi:hypothetical protein [Sutcliffiella horikoshii]|nr:hypothetical protein [Sutcliffiella horikoshii]
MKLRIDDQLGLSVNVRGIEKADIYQAHYLTGDGLFYADGEGTRILPLTL